MENGRLTMKKKEKETVEAPDDQVWSQKNLTVIATFCAKNLLFCSGYEC